MLLGLVIRDIVLIERLDLTFGDGLTVLTGETGAGKSILLDSLGLALGARADSSLVRQGVDKGMVTARFSLTPIHPVRRFLKDRDLACDDDDLVLRRVVNADGGSRAYVNDQPASVSILRALGDMLVEVHGQHDDRGLLDSAGHRALLDAFGDLSGSVIAVGDAHGRLRLAEKALAAAQADLAAARADEDYLRHSLEELEHLAPEPGEEQALADRRAMMMQGEKLAGSLTEIHEELLDGAGIDASLRGVLRRLERLETESDDLLLPVITALDRATIELTEGLAALEQVRTDLDFDPLEAERVEERLFALRALARKHKCRAEELPDLRTEMAARLEQVDAGDKAVKECMAAVAHCRVAFRDMVMALRTARKDAATRLDQAVNAELPPLKLEKARFRTRMRELDEADWTMDGGERVTFEVSTNPGAPFGDLIKIASGGELARFILALKVSLASRMNVATLVFDEVDRGIGGATADAVGERLARLADNAQVLVVTHSPQVAARGDEHLMIMKSDQADGAHVTTVTDVMALDLDARREEIARMLSGAAVTDEARAAASRLMRQTA